MKPCYICKTTKEYSPLGYIKKKCFKCDGIGYLDDALVDDYHLSQLEVGPPLMPLLNDFKSTMDEHNEQVTKPKKKPQKPKTKPVLQLDHPLNKLKDKIANVNT